ncbi:hypothetical protein SLEP1_g4702 [Rubroshorea leprosula]|uniref:laccase n=1 Tax=Rubroshorea leprosula TaxID=152421 RepID=A0AAV5HYE7_9ROSI|nr:hypothetical protein SLEP1_g4702 [Rubroshorea leprosula]
MVAFSVLLLLKMLLFSAQGDVHYYDFYGDTVFVNVHNEGNYGVTLHWHGVKQPRNPWSDGPEYVTQCPVLPRTNFTYEVIFSDEEGTLWWHAHSDWTRNTVHGAIVIYPSKEASSPYPEPDGSWYAYDVNLLVAETLLNGGDLPISDAYTSNGQPGDFCACSKVEYGKTYLLRIINAVMNAEMFFAIAGHNLTIVSTDAAYLKPFVSSHVVIGPGQTMDVPFTANQSFGHYYMAARRYYTDKAIFTEYDSKCYRNSPVQWRLLSPFITLLSYPSSLSRLQCGNKL